MVMIVREVGNYLGCEKALLTSNENKIHALGKRVCKKSSDYDQTWKELNATQRADGDFELPCALPAVPSGASTEMHDHQRWQASARNTFMESVLTSIRKQLMKEKLNFRNNASSYSTSNSLQEKTLNVPVL
jgi:hypothetical protein